MFVKYIAESVFLVKFDMKRIVSVMPDNWILLYDEECPLCRRFVSSIERLNRGKNFSLFSLQYYSRIDTRFSKDQLLKSLHIISDRGAVLTGGAALQKTLMLLPASRPYRWMLNGMVGRGAASTVYKTLNTIRRCYQCGRRR
jgi:predicted DCC family thiol-disulfide oxidoreductase YuxK